MTKKILVRSMRPSWLTSPCSFTMYLNGTHSMLIVNQQKPFLPFWGSLGIFPPHASTTFLFNYAVKTLISTGLACGHLQWECSAAAYSSSAWYRFVKLLFPSYDNHRSESGFQGTLDLFYSPQSVHAHAKLESS